MKNEEFLADAIGGLDEELLFSVNRKREMDDTNTLVVVKDGTETKKKRSVRKFWLPLAAALVLLLGVAVVGAAALMRELRIGETENGDKTVEYVPESYATVPLSELTGDVLQAPTIMKQRLLRYLAGETLPKDGTSGDELITFIVEYPSELYKPFETIDDAEAYIGYAGMHMPRLNRPTAQVGVVVSGSNEGGLRGATEDTEYELILAGLAVGYHFGEMGNAVAGAVIQFGDNYQHGPLTYLNAPDISMATETRLVGSRQFHILRISDEYHGAINSVSVYWDENSVQYTLQAFYQSGDAEAAEELITEWMNAFTD